MVIVGEWVFIRCIVFVVKIIEGFVLIVDTGVKNGNNNAIADVIALVGGC